MRPSISRLCAILLGFSPTAAAFGTINEPQILKQHNEHEMITRLALQCPSGKRSDGICFEPRSLDQLAGFHVNVMGIAIPGAGSNGAVGAPDTLDPAPEGAEAHCDNADYLDVPGYPQNRTEANAQLQQCVDHLRRRFRQAVGAAARLLDDRNRIRHDMVDIPKTSGGDCTFAFANWQSDDYGRAKCSTIEGFGRALHGVQDFYAHSNWADSEDPTQPISATNPPGLRMEGIAPFLDLRAKGIIPAHQIPRNLTTGCFSIPDTPAGSGPCQGRVTHSSLSKDHGIIRLDGSFGAVKADPRSDAVSTNFRLTVTAAVQHSRETWANFRDAVREHYGKVRGDLMICSLVSDDPVRNCRKRTAVLAVDMSSQSEASRGLMVEYDLAEALNSRLNVHGLDSVAFVDNQIRAVLHYPMGSPVNATLDISQPSGDLCIASGLELAMAETIYAEPETYTDRSAIVILSASAESPEFHGSTLAKLGRAAREGIRVHYACINMPADAGADGSSSSPWTSCTPGDPLVPAVLKTGGTVAFINGTRARIAAHFANAVMDHGLTATDDDDDDNDDNKDSTTHHTRVYPGITRADSLNPEHTNKSFFYPVTAGENLNFTVTSIPVDGQGPEGCFTVTLWHKYRDMQIDRHMRCGDSSPLSLVYQATESFEVVLETEYHRDMAPEDELLRQQDILFTVSVDTDMPEKDETTVQRTTSIMSSNATMEVSGSAPQCFLTSEMVELLTSTVTANGSTSTATESHRATDQGPFPFCCPATDEFPTCSVPTVTATMMAGNVAGDLGT